MWNVSNRLGARAIAACLPTARALATYLPIVVLVVVVALMLFAEPASAGDGGEGFKTIYEDLTKWVKGYLGKLIALFAFVVGLFYGAIKQNFIMALGGVGIAIMIAVMPSLLDSLITAVI